MVPRFAPRNARMAWLRWLPTVLAFPLGGTLAHAVAGPADHLTATLLGGALTGAVLGMAQALALRSGVSPLRGVGATPAGLAGGLALGAAAVGYGTSPADLALQGAITGAMVGIVQTRVLHHR